MSLGVLGSEQDAASQRSTSARRWWRFFRPSVPGVAEPDPAPAEQDQPVKPSLADGAPPKVLQVLRGRCTLLIDCQQGLPYRLCRPIAL